MFHLTWGRCSRGSNVKHVGTMVFLIVATVPLPRRETRIWYIWLDSTLTTKMEAGGYELQKPRRNKMDGRTECSNKFLEVIEVRLLLRASSTHCEPGFPYRALQWSCNCRRLLSHDKLKCKCASRLTSSVTARVSGTCNLCKRIATDLGADSFSRRRCDHSLPSRC